MKQQYQSVPLNERERLDNALKAVKEEEARAARLYTTGTISDEVWTELWQDCQDRRRKINSALNALGEEFEQRIESLDIALELLSRVAGLYEEMTMDERLDLMRLMIEKMIVNAERQVRVVFKPPFGYLEEKIRGVIEAAKPEPGQTKAARRKPSSGQSGHAVGVQIISQIAVSAVHQAP